MRWTGAMCREMETTECVLFQATVLEVHHKSPVSNCVPSGYKTPPPPIYPPTNLHWAPSRSRICHAQTKELRVATVYPINAPWQGCQRTQYENNFPHPELTPRTCEVDRVLEMRFIATSSVTTDVTGMGNPRGTLRRVTATISFERFVFRYIRVSALK
jgi:hypothetical protein